MGFNNQELEVEFTEQCIAELNEIYDYISNILKENAAAKRIIERINQRILDLSMFPEQHMKIGKVDILNREYRRIVVKNYIVLYTIDYDNKKIYISHIVYKRRNYME